MDVLYHVSDVPDIARFDPRPAPRSGRSGAMVWAIDDAHLHNYLLPRDCPRVTFYPLADTTPQDIALLMGGSGARAVVAIESAWFEAARSAKLYRYDFPTTGFECVDPGAGYHVAHHSVEPVGMVRVEDPLGQILRRNVELRVMPSLWDLHDRVVASSLQFSIIRMRNATPRNREASTR